VDELVIALFPCKESPPCFTSGRNGWLHCNLVDRACVGHCYSYGNYEAATLQFRIRAARNNPYILAEIEESDRLAQGSYLVQRVIFVVPNIFVCPRITDLCIRALKAGEFNGSVRVHALGMQARDAFGR